VADASVSSLTGVYGQNKTTSGKERARPAPSRSSSVAAEGTRRGGGGGSSGLDMQSLASILTNPTIPFLKVSNAATRVTMLVVAVRGLIRSYLGVFCCLSQMLLSPVLAFAFDVILTFCAAKAKCCCRHARAFARVGWPTCSVFDA